MKSKLPLLLLLTVIVSLFTFCKKEKVKKVDEEETSIIGVWQRYGSPKGYKTDLAIGNIPGEPPNRVYMCEHPGSPSAGLYKGYINGNVITWDAAHGLPDAEFNEVGGVQTLYFGVGAVSDAAKYKKGVWTNTCGELKIAPKSIYYRWTTSSNCTIPAEYFFTYSHPDLPFNLTKNQQYGPIAGGSLEIILNHNGSNFNSYYNTLPEPPNGYKRIYTHNVFVYDNTLNRCIFNLGQANISYIDQRL